LLSLTILLALSIADVVGGGHARAAGPQASPTPVRTLSVTVQQGDSLWVIAERTAPDTDPREVVLSIQELNGMRSNTIQPGQVLLVPRLP